MAKNTGFDPYSDINGIVRYKGDWTNAADDTARNTAASNAAPLYQNLKDNGYEDVAEELRNADYATAQKIANKYAMSGKTEIRPFMKNSELTSTYQMTDKEVDDLIKFNETTGEVTFGGKNIGKPYSIVNGTSYWDADVLRKELNDYIARSGITAPNDKLIAKGNTGVSNKINELWGIQTDDHKNLTNLYNQEYDYLKNTNPFETEVGKAILGKYDLSALQARDNAAASGGASNGGNIDSYAAANALRQQASLISQGQDAVLSAHQQRLDNARSLLESLGVSQQNNYTSMQNTIGMEQNEAQRLFENEQSEAQRLFENEQTAINNDVARKSEIAAVSGYTPDEWVVSNNPYMNDDGTLKAEYLTKEFDDAGGFSAIMAKAKAAGNTEAYNAAAKARFYKVTGDYGKYGQYDDGNYLVPSEQRTADYDLTNKQIDSAERIANAENETAKYGIDADKFVAGAQIAANAATKQQANPYTVDGTANGKPTISLEDAIEAYKSGSTSPSVIYALEYYGQTEKAAAEKKNEDELTIKNNLKETLTEDSLGKGFAGEQMTFVNDVLIPYLTTAIGEYETDPNSFVSNLEDFFVENSEAYDLEWNVINKILTTLGFDYSVRGWLDNYRNAGWAGTGHGIVKKEGK